MKTTTRLLLLLSLLTFPGLLPAQSQSQSHSTTQTMQIPGMDATSSISVTVETLPDGTANPAEMRTAWTAEAEALKDAEIIGPDATAQTLSRLNKTVVVKGAIQGATSIIHGDFFLLGTAQGPVSVVGGNATILGTATGPVSVVGGNLRVAGKITGDASVVGGSLVKAPGAVISGNTSSATLGNIWSSSSCISKKKAGNHACNFNLNSGSLCGHRLAWRAVIAALKLAAGALWLATAALLAFLIPAPLEKALGYLKSDALTSVGIGLLFWIVFGFLLLISLALCLLLIGFPMLGLLALVALAVKAFGITVVFLWTGRLLCARFQRETTSTVTPVVIGGLALVLLRLIPCLGSLLWLAVVIVSAGISILALVRRTQTATPGQ